MHDTPGLAKVSKATSFKCYANYHCFLASIVMIVNNNYNCLMWDCEYIYN